MWNRPSAFAPSQLSITHLCARPASLPQSCLPSLALTQSWVSALKAEGEKARVSNQKMSLAPIKDFTPGAAGCWPEDIRKKHDMSKTGTLVVFSALRQVSARAPFSPRQGKGSEEERAAQGPSSPHSAHPGFPNPAEGAFVCVLSRERQSARRTWAPRGGWSVPPPSRRPQDRKRRSGKRGDGEERQEERGAG